MHLAHRVHPGRDPNAVRFSFAELLTILRVASTISAFCLSHGDFYVRTPHETFQSLRHDRVIAPDGHGVGRYRWYENETDPAQREYALMAHGCSHRKRMVEGPQLCHRMKPVQPEVIRGKDFVAVRIT